MKTAEEIAQWLHSQFWFDAFKKNLVVRWDGYREPMIDMTLSGYFGDKTIQGAFSWDNTPEGFDYWSKINKDFKQWLNNNREKKGI